MKTILAHMLSRLTRSKSLHIQAVLFFALALCSFVFAVGSEPAQLANIMPGLVWAILLLSSLLGLNDLLDADYTDGTLDDYLLSPHPLPALMAMKMIAHFTATTLPASIAATICMVTMVQDSATQLPALFAGLILGGMSFSGIGLLGAALTLGSRRASTLQAIIVMPLCVPALIFGAGAAAAPQLGVSPATPLFFLAAFTTALITLTPFAAAAILRMKVTTP